MGDPLLRVTALRKVFGEHVAVDGVSFDVAEGGSLAIVGESGSGKTTIARMLVGLERPTAGTIAFGGRDRTQPAKSNHERRERSHEMQLVFQDPYTSLDPRQTVEACLDEALRLYRGGTAESRRPRVDELADMVGLDARQRRSLPRALSGGQRQRVAIARVLAGEPMLVILDEAVAALDVSIQAQVLNLFIELRAALNLTYLFISHDLGVVRFISDRVVVMYLGRVVERAAADELFARPNHPYTIALLGEVGKVQPGKRTFVPIKGEIPSPLDPPHGCHFHPRCPFAMDKCRERAPPLREIAPGHLSACFLNDD